MHTLCSPYLHVQAEALSHTAGVGRGLLGVVGLPLSGALGLVGAVTNGLASSAGLVPAHAVRRPGRTQGVYADNCSAYGLVTCWPSCETCNMSFDEAEVLA